MGECFVAYVTDEVGSIKRLDSVDDFRHVVRECFWRISLGRVAAQRECGVAGNRKADPESTQLFVIDSCVEQSEIQTDDTKRIRPIYVETQTGLFIAAFVDFAQPIGGFAPKDGFLFFRASSS
jgi:hypothetical protein